MLDDDHITSDDLRKLEVHADTQFQAIGVCFSRSNDRFAAFDNRLDRVERQLLALARSIETHCNEIDNRIDVNRMWLGHIHVQLSSEIIHAHRDLRRIVVLGLVGVTVSTALLCLGMILRSL